MKHFQISILLCLPLFLFGCSADEQPLPKNKADLTIYTGITMVRPLNQLVQEFEQKNNVQIDIKQGATGYLFNTILEQQNVDLFLPGSESYRLEAKDPSIWLDRVLVGYNKVALMVAKNNPKNLNADLKWLYNPEISIVIASPESCAVGKELKQILDQAGITKPVYNNVTYFTTDSHRLSKAIKVGHADLAVNWFAVSKWQENASFIDAIPLPANIAKPKKLELNLMSFSKNPSLAKNFMNYVHSEHGLRVFAEYGFLTYSELQSELRLLQQSGQ